jgi:hypothetical protein
MTLVDRSRYEQDGYLIIPVLSPAERKRFLDASNELVSRPRYRKTNTGSPSKFLVSVPFLRPGHHHPVLVESILLPKVHEVTEVILGSPLVVDNAVLLSAEAGTDYQQGWHRDVLQIPQNQIDEAMFSPRWRHNSVQINLPLVEDHAFWAVPGSHQRPNSPEENEAFAGSKHFSPVNARMPSATCFALQPGEAIFYNNNMIHRGWCAFTRPRRTLHMGYHCSQRPPTWHFYSDDPRRYPKEYLKTLTEPVRSALLARSCQRQRYPDVTESYRSGYIR